MRQIKLVFLFFALFIFPACGGNLPPAPEKIICFDFMRGPLTAKQQQELMEEIAANDPIGKKENWIKFKQPQYVLIGKYLCQNGQYIYNKPYLTEKYVLNRSGDLFIVLTNERGKKEPLHISELEKESANKVKKELALP